MSDQLPPDCRAARIWASAALDREATPAELEALDAHVRECTACARWRALAGAVVLRVRTAPPVQPVAPVALPLPGRRSRTGVAARASAYAAVVAAAAVLGMLAADQHRGTDTARRAIGPLTIARVNQRGFFDGVPSGTGASAQHVHAHGPSRFLRVSVS